MSHEHNNCDIDFEKHTQFLRPSRVADTPPLLPISRYGHCLFVADVCLCYSCVVRSFSQVVLGLPLGLFPCRRPIIRSSVMPPFLRPPTRWPWKASPSRRVGFVLALLNTSSLVTCSVNEMRSSRRWSCSVRTLDISISLNVAHYRPDHYCSLHVSWYVCSKNSFT